MVEVIQEAAKVGKSPDFDAKLCTYILDIISGNGRVATIDRPFGYNNDIQPFLPCSVLQGGVVERKHDRKTQTPAMTWAFRSMVTKQLFSRTEENGFELVMKAAGRQLSWARLCGGKVSSRCHCSSAGSPCFWLPLSFHSGTHILDKTRRYRLPVPVNRSLCYYDYVQPCAPGTGLIHDVIVKQRQNKDQNIVILCGGHQSSASAATPMKLLDAPKNKRCR